MAARARLAGVRLGRVRPTQLAPRVGQRRRPLALQIGHEGHPVAARLGAQRQPAQLVQADPEDARRWPPGCGPRSGCRPGAGRRRSRRRTRPPCRSVRGSARARVNAVPLVPSETMASPAVTPRPSPPAMLSPVPGATAIPVGVWPTISAGPATRGSSSSWPMAGRPGPAGTRWRSRRSSRCRRRRPDRWSARSSRPAICQVSQSCGSATAPYGRRSPVRREPASGSWTRSSRRPAPSRPRRPRPAPPPSSAIRSTASGRRPVVVPQQGVPDQFALIVQGDHAVLLTADGQRRDPVEQGRIGRGLLIGGQPRRGRHLGARRMRGPGRADHRRRSPHRTPRP